jgi:4-aminobutyrate aminotransferase-like enzyme
MADLHPRKPLSPAEIVILPKCCTEFHRTAQSKVTSIPVASVKEAIYRGSEGERYLDFTSQPRIRNIGNGYPCVVRIVAKPISDLAYVNSVTMTTAVHALPGAKLEKLLRGDIDKLFPPLRITEQELAEGFEVLDWALEIRDRAVTR